jgi:hypothetical protein
MPMCQARRRRGGCDEQSVLEMEKELAEVTKWQWLQSPAGEEGGRDRER